MSLSRDEHDNKLTDVVDIAALTEARERDTSLAEVQRRARPQQAPRSDGTYEVTDCEDCGDQIGEARLRVAVMNRLCVYCAARRERR